MLIVVCKYFIQDIEQKQNVCQRLVEKALLQGRLREMKASCFLWHRGALDPGEKGEGGYHRRLLLHILNDSTEPVAIWKAGEPQEENTNSESCLKMNLKAKATLLLTTKANIKKKIKLSLHSRGY